MLQMCHIKKARKKKREREREMQRKWGSGQQWDRHKDGSRESGKESEIEEKIQKVGKCCRGCSRVQVTHLGARVQVTQEKWNNNKVDLSCVSVMTQVYKQVKIHQTVFIRFACHITCVLYLNFQKYIKHQWSAQILGLENSLVIREGSQGEFIHSHYQGSNKQTKKPKEKKKNKKLWFSKKEVPNCNSFSFFQLRLNCYLNYQDYKPK